MDKFEAAKTISALEVAKRYYGGKFTRRGGNEWALCPFHSEKTPSCAFEVDKPGSLGRFYCQGCHAGGTSIDFVMRYFSLSKRDAALKICADYGLQTDDEQPLNPLTRRELDAAKKAREAQEREAAELELARIHFETVVCVALRRLREYRDKLEPKERDSDEGLSKEFCNVLKQLSVLEEVDKRLMDIMQRGDDPQELRELMDAYRPMMKTWEAIGRAK